MDDSEETGHMELGAGSKQDRDAADWEKGARDGQTAVERASVAESRGRDNMEDKSTGEGAMLTEGRDSEGLGSVGEGDSCKGGSGNEGGGMCKEL
jgi:hypothetical protein